jgi:hypothetical protein
LAEVCRYIIGTILELNSDWLSDGQDNRRIIDDLAALGLPCLTAEMIASYHARCATLLRLHQLDQLDPTPLSNVASALSIFPSLQGEEIQRTNVKAVTQSASRSAVESLVKYIRDIAQSQSVSAVVLEMLRWAVFSTRQPALGAAAMVAKIISKLLTDSSDTTAGSSSSAQVQYNQSNLRDAFNNFLVQHWLPSG